MNKNLSRNNNQSTGRLVPRVADMKHYSIKGPIRQSKIIETLNDHFRDYTYKPKICNMSKDIIKRKRIEAMQQFSELRKSIIGENDQNKSLNDLTNLQNSMISNSYDNRIMNRKRSFKDTKIESIMESQKMNSWLNRSIDQCTHSRLYNDAKYHYARKLHRKRMEKGQEYDECTFQPQLVTDTDLTMRMCAQHSRNIESRNEILKNSIE